MAGRLDGPAMGQSFGALLDWLVFWFGSGVWSMGRLVIASIVQLFGGTVVRCVCRLFCGQLEDWSVRLLVGCSVGQSVFRIVRRLVGGSVDCLVVRLSLAHGRSVCHLGSGWTGWMVDGFVGLFFGRSFGVLVASLWIGWLLVLVRRSVSHLDERSIGEFGACVVVS